MGGGGGWVDPRRRGGRPPSLHPSPFVLCPALPLGAALFRVAIGFSCVYLVRIFHTFCSGKLALKGIHFRGIYCVRARWGVLLALRCDAWVFQLLISPPFLTSHQNRAFGRHSRRLFLLLLMSNFCTVRRLLLSVLSVRSCLCCRMCLLLYACLARNVGPRSISAIRVIRSIRIIRAIRVVSLITLGFFR